MTDADTLGGWLRRYVETDAVRAKLRELHHIRLNLLLQYALVEADIERLEIEIDERESPS